MYKNIKPFGLHIFGSSIGEGWLSLVEAVLKNGDKTFDENRGRLSLQNVRFRVENPNLPDSLIDVYGNKERIDAMVYLTFKGEEMYDFDVVPSFSPGAKSYYSRIKEGKMDEFVVQRLGLIPESKKAVISFINWNDYKAVLKNPYDDYLPCIVSIQFRLVNKNDHFEMTTNFNARSLDAFQKAGGNFIAIAMLSQKIARKLEEIHHKKIVCTVLDRLITDAHIYEECLSEAKKVIADYKQSKD